MPVSRGWHLALHNESFMSDNNDNSFTDRYSTKRVSQAWAEASSPIVRFRTDDGTCSGFIFHYLEYANFERDTLLLDPFCRDEKVRSDRSNSQEADNRIAARRVCLVCVFQ